MVVTTSSSQIDEIRRADDDTFAARGCTRFTSRELDYRPRTFRRPFQYRGTIHKKHRRAKFADVQNEIAAAFEDDIPIKGDGTFFASERTILLAGCRMDTYDHHGTLSAGQAAGSLSAYRCTMILTGWIEQEVYTGYGLSSPPPCDRITVAPLLRDNVLKRRRNTGKTGQGEPLEVRRHEGAAKKYPFVMVKAILVTNFVAIHTTTMTLASPIRRWSKSSAREMWKLDGFIKESPAVYGSSSVEGLHFSNGMTTPAGSIVNVPYRPVHTDTTLRVSMALGLKGRAAIGQEGEEHKHQLVTAGVGYILFSHGRHGCPGRFFVINEVKVLLARVLLKNNVKMADGQDATQSRQFGTGTNMSAKVMFRKQEA
ncbi:Cytochrome P450 [Amanita muscaria]